MNSLKQFLLLEKAKTETKSPYELLLPYKDREDIFISFTKINKIGINPKSNYDTPNGIYAYPIKQFWEKYDIDKYKKVAMIAPFAGSSKYIQVLQLVDNSHFINDLKNDYGKNEFTKDLNKLKSIYVNDTFFTNNIDKEFIELSSIILNNEDIKKMDLFDFMTFLNKEDMVIYFFDRIIGDTFFSYKDIKDELNKTKNIILNNFNLFEFYYAITSIEQNCKKKEYYAGRIWYILYILSKKFYHIVLKEISKKDMFGTYSSNQRWNNMMRYLGYDGVADRSGVGIIHENEPLQAVFFSVKPIKHINTIINSELTTKKYSNMNIYQLYELLEMGDINIDNFRIPDILKKINFNNKKDVAIFKKIFYKFLYKIGDNNVYDKKIEDSIVTAVMLTNDDDFIKDVFLKYKFYPNENSIAIAINNDNISIVKFILDNYPELLSLKEYRDYYLHKANIIKNDDMIKMLKNYISEYEKGI